MKQNRRCEVHVGVVIGCCALATTGHAIEYEIIDLGTLTDRTSIATAVNESGQVTGFSAVSGGSQVISKDPHIVTAEPWFFHGIAWDDSGKLLDLGVLGPDVPVDVFPKPDSRGNDVNAAGQIVGESTQPGQPYQGMLWLPEASGELGAGLHELPPLVEGGHVRLYSLNDDGIIVGEAALPGHPGPRAVRWEYIGGKWVWTDLGDLGGPYGRAGAVNNLGQIAGQANVPSGNLQAFLWLKEPAYGLDAGIHNIVPTLGTTSPKDINENGEIVGEIGAVPPQAFVWLPEAAYGLPDGGSVLNPSSVIDGQGASAFDMNNHGTIVGEVWTLFIHPVIGPTLGRHAMIWNEGDMQLLDELLPAESGWELISAQGINDAGEIVGWGIPPGETENGHGFLLRPVPAPSADLNGDGLVGPADLAMLLGTWGACRGECTADLNGDGSVGPADLAVLLGSWG